MIAGIGTDIVEVERIANKLVKANGFKNLVFSKAEIAYCESKTNKAEHFAARFAAKEAFLKAIGTGLSIEFDLNEIEVLNKESGQPYFRFSDGLQSWLATKGYKNILVSISHTKSMASAYVVVEI